MSSPFLVSLNELNVALDSENCSSTEFEKLKLSIQERGLLNPVIVSVNKTGGYTLIAGFKRVRACIELEYKFILATMVPTRGPGGASREGE